jgi:hypothetical protein
MSVYAGIEAEVLTLIGATWEDVTGPALCTQIQELSRNLIDQALGAAQGDSTKIAAPYAILGMGKVAQDPEGSHGDYRRLPLKVWYVCTSSGDTTSIQDWCATKGEALLAAFQTGTFTTFQVIGDDRGYVDSRAEVAFADESLKVFCAEVGFDTGLLTLVT